MEFLKISNRGNFLLKEIPIINPASKKYIKWWREAKKRCVDGFWSIDEAGVDVDILPEEPNFPKSKSWRYMPPNCYFYVNFGTILMNKGGSSSGAKVPSRPNLDDVEWEFTYNWMEARGFSGFEFDTKYSCNRRLIEEYTDDELNQLCVDSTGEVNSMLLSNYFDKKGNRKEYISCRQYIRQLFEEPLGRPIYGNIPKNLSILATRDGGKSWLSAGCVIAHEILFDGMRIYDKNQIMPIAEVVVGSGLSDKSRDLLKKVSFIIDNLPGKYNKGKRDEVHCPFYKTMTGSIGANKDYIHQYKKKVGGEMRDVGSMAVIKHRVFTSENPEAAAGGRPGTIVIEEQGLCFAKDTKIRMYDMSLKNIQDIKVGDIVLGHTGSPDEVISTKSGVSKLYKVEQKFGIDYVVSKNHIMYVNKKYKNYHTREIFPTKQFVQDFCNNSMSKSELKETYGLANDCLIFNENPSLKLEPYFLGAWIGDGYSNRPSICAHSNSIELINYIKEYANRLNMICIEHPENENFGSYYISTKIGNNKIHKSDTRNNENYVSRTLKEYGIFTDKKIPIDYQYASEEDRLQLLAGLIDTDGCLVNRRNDSMFEFYQTNREELVDQVKLLAKNLGFRVIKSVRRINTGYGKKILPEYRNKYTLRITGDISRIPVKISYKKTIYNNNTKHINSTPIKVSEYKYGKYYGFTLKNNPLFLLEDGTIVHNTPNLISVHGGNVGAQNDSGVKFGSSLYIGTAGNIEKIRDAEIIFNNPEGFDMLAFDNIWEPEHKDKIGWFIPAPYMARRFKDRNGNTMKKEAYEFFEKRRVKAAQSPSKKTFEMEKMNYPLVPSEMFVNAEQNIFPTSELKHHYSRIASNEKLLKQSYKVNFFIREDNGQVDFKNVNKLPIRNFPLVGADVDMSGCPEIFALPQRADDGTVPGGMYLFGYDPVDDDDNTDTQRSLQSFFIGNRFTREIVFEYTGRTQLATEFYEQCRLAALYYNARGNYENNKKGFYAHMLNKASLYLLMETPDILLQKDMQKSRGMGNKSLGTNTNADITAWGLELILQWLTERAPIQPSDTSQITLLQTIKSPALLKELMQYKADGNFDRISALIMLMIAFEEKRRFVVATKKKINSALDDDFFAKTWRG